MGQVIVKKGMATDIVVKVETEVIGQQMNVTILYKTWYVFFSKKIIILTTNST